MRILLCGKNDAAVEALEHLIARRDEVRVIGVHGDEGRDGWQRSLVRAARRLGVPCERPARVNEPACIAALAAWRPDLVVSIQYDQILKAPFFAGIGCPCLNLHFALLPRNRGVAPIAWAILEGDAETGATLHHMRVEIDAGDVVAARAVAIGARDTGRMLYDKVSAAATELFRAAHPFGRGLLERRVPQDPSRATYHRAGELDFSRREVDWRMQAARLQRWLRAFVFPPFQWPLFAAGGRRLAVTAVDGAVRATDAAPGTVLSLSETALEVAAGGGSVRLLGCAGLDGRAVAFDALSALLRPGTVLSSAGSDA